MVLRNTDMQGDAAANQEHDHGILLQPLKKKKKRDEKNFVLCFTVAASKLTMQPKGILSCQDHSGFLGLTHRAVLLQDASDS